ncbi:ABC-type antimicrobial peptide transport system permease subunit [Algoriphagus sp. 4150]|uniref:ABC transporter permease n=1 Tax=Algoriphagus sp. 4150 TaxID=2817756 RepID=UPI00285858DD|nr:ABC transporter permease [Algoriphagus sp. 4150]MDR7132298.1 ABC-type antimicrobial peptide transport system permease subunit [Algoriphagus sp. 4150]
MLKNYLKIAWRSLLRKKGFAFINIGGLAIGMAASVLIMVWIQFEFSVDSQYEKSDRIYSVWRTNINQGESITWNATPTPYATALQEQYPEVEAVTHVTEWDPMVLSVGENSFYEQTTFVDPGFFEMFDFRVLEGNPMEAMSSPDHIILTKSVARKLFGEESALGKSVTVESELEFEVKAIVEDLPENTNFKFTAFLPYNKLEAIGWTGNYWGNNNCRTFAMLKADSDLNSFNQKIVDFSLRNGDVQNTTDFLFPMSELHLKSKFENGKSVGGRIDLIRMFGLVGIVILLIACINFVNLSTAQSEKRAKEVGIRKVSGADRGMLIGQFLAESILISVAAYLLALLLISLLFPGFNQLIGKELKLPFNQPYFWVFSLGYVFLTGILAGIYPAFLLSSFKPVLVLKSRMSSAKSWFKPREVLVVFQFTIVAILIASTWIIREQMQFVQNRDLGLQTENLIFHPMTAPLKKNFSAVRSEVEALPGIVSVSSTFSPFTEEYSNTNTISWQGKEDAFMPNINRMGADAHVVKTAGLQLIAGRDIDVYTNASDSTAVLINETARDFMGFADPLGEIVKDGDREYRVVGVVKDFIIESPFANPEGIMIFGPKIQQNFIHIRLSGADLQTTLAQLGGIFRKFNPGSPFEYKFSDEVHAQKFASQQQTGSLTAIFSGLAILISCLGLFGLAAFIAEQRSKEISVRKVLGASVQGLVLLLSGEFTKLVLIAMLIGVPITWYAMSAWLEGFDYRIGIDWKVFLGTGLIALLIAFLTVSSQAIKAALVNPAKTLKSD